MITARASRFDHWLESSLLESLLGSMRSNISDANEILGARGGANGGRYRATPGHIQPLSVQLNSTSGHVRDVWRLSEVPPKR